MPKIFICLLFAFYLLAREVLLPAVVAQSEITQTTATLSEARYALAATSSGELVFFGGGQSSTGPSDRVDIYNVTSGSWTTATLSVPRFALAAVSSGNLVLFAGGWNGTTPYISADIYNVWNGSWSTATLSQARFNLAAASVGDLVLFGGGFNYKSWSNVVDIYNVTSNTWTTATLSQSRSRLAATSVANQYALFAGGWNETVAFNVVDIFDSSSRAWNITTLSQARLDLAAVSLGNLAFFGGGQTYCCPGQTFNVIDIFNATTHTWSTATLSQNRTWLAAASIGDTVAFGGGYIGTTFSAVVDMYNVTSNVWFTADLSQPRDYLAATSSSNKIFFGGGNSSTGYSNIVAIFVIPIPPLQPMPVASPIPIPTLPTLASIPSNAGTVPLSLNGALIGGLIGGIVGALLVGGGIIVLVIFLRKRKQKKSSHTANEDNDKTKKPVESDEDGAVLKSQQQTVTLESDTTTTLTYAQTVTETLKSLTPGQIPLNELEIGKEIGQGTYGRVCVGKWKKYRVALKFCQNKGKMDEFLKEANLMITLPPHPNVVRMYGVSIDGTQPIIVMEYCAGDSLDKVLYDERQHISTETKIRWAYEIALGMCHLHKHNIVHRDLAARNILLSQPNLADAQPKIADFGISRLLEQTASEGAKKMRLTLWMSPESLARQVYSKKSDMWMFGMLVYEIVARREPFADKDPQNISTRIRDEGLTPTIPKVCPVVLRDVMQMCWKKKPKQRPTMEVVLAYLESALEEAEATQRETEGIAQSAKNQNNLATISQDPVLKRSQIITFTEVTVERKIGTGSYGKVCLGKWNAAPVALKFCRKKGNLEEFMREIRLMIELPAHPNVVQLFGVSLDGPQPIIVLEYCAGGSLDKLLFQTNATLSDEHKMRLVRGIAAGMLHLHKHNIVHRDLAARNILLTSGGDPKISDFGMSRILEKEDEGKTNSTIGPVCWMAPESLAHSNYSKKSDVWTFGIVVYEIVAQCEPHKDQQIFQIGTRIRDEGLTPTIPSNCPPKLRELMQMCWQMQPEQRPSFEAICALVEP